MVWMISDTSMGRHRGALKRPKPLSDRKMERV
jgi:hypothetical protein